MTQGRYIVLHCISGQYGYIYYKIVTEGTLCHTFNHISIDHDFWWLVLRTTFCTLVLGHDVLLLYT